MRRFLTRNWIGSVVAALLVSVGLVVAIAASSAGASTTPATSKTTGPTTTTGSGTPTTAAQLQAEVQNQLATTSGGTQVGNDVVSYDNGNVQIVFPEPGATIAPTYIPDQRRSKHISATAADYQNCPTGVNTYYSCFYQNAGFGGTRAQFKDCGSRQYFSNYGFDRQTSSWVNTKPQAFVDTWDNQNTALWHEKEARNSGNGQYSYSTYVGDPLNDRASSMQITVDGGGGICNN